MPDATPPTARPPGWYRLTKDGWQPLTDEQAQAAIDAGELDLVKIETVTEDVPLW